MITYNLRLQLILSVAVILYALSSSRIIICISFVLFRVMGGNCSNLALFIAV